MNNDSYTGVQKAAILLITLGPEKAATIFKHLKEDEIEELTLEIANTRSVSPQTKEEVLEEFYQVCLAQQYIAEGGIGYAKELLEKALGNDKAQGVIAKLTASLQVRPFEFIRKTDPAQLLNFIQDEHPQTIAMILSYLAPAQASQVLGALPPEKQADVAKRIATMDRTSPDVIKEVERVLERKLASLVNQDYTIVGGIDAIVGILNSVDRGTEKHIMESLEIEEPELADEIRKKMFVFEDILLLDDRAIQRVLRDVENADLELALKNTTEEVQNVIYKNLSKRLAAMIKEDMDFMGPVRMKDVEEAQQKIVAVIRKLEDAGEIVISRGGGDDGTRIINSNDGVRQKLKELQQEQAPEQVDVSAEDGQENAPAGFSQGIQAKTVQIDVEALRREVLEKAAVEADEITSTAKEDAERIRGEAEEKARTLYEEQKKLGYEEGARCREEELNREHEKAMESLHAQKKQLEEQYHEKMSVMEKDIVDAVIQVFDKVFKIQFEEKRELLLQLVNGALLDIDPGDKIRIHTNRSDEEILKEHLAQMQDIVGKDVAIEFIKDNKLSDGQCKIETPYGVVDCGVDTQLSALLKDIRSLV